MATPAPATAHVKKVYPQPTGRPAEVLPVPVGMVKTAWRSLAYFFRRIPGYDSEKLHHALLVGKSTLWVAVEKAPAPKSLFLGVLVTTVLERPPTQQKAFRRTNPDERRSLVVHLAEGRRIEAWIANAVERISRYGWEHGCRQLFLQSSSGWLEFARRFYSDAWLAAGYTRDRHKPVKTNPRRARPGYYRLLQLVPASQWKPYMENSGTHFYIKEKPHDSICP